jgi:23S rRNA (cytidine2498-2'-O)-methyltransferase
MRGYLALPEREPELLDELHHAGARVLESHGRLLLTDNGPSHAAWASNVWLEPERIAIDSIGGAVRELQARQRNWALLGDAHHRRATLIQEGLPHVSHRPMKFGEKLPRAPLGSWALLEPNLLLASPRCSSPFPHGELEFVEDRHAPPSRAYLKLWELFTLSGKFPQHGEFCLDLGSSPGGWTWVLAKLGARVDSVDKSPLDPKIAGLAGVRFQRRSAFAIDPKQHPVVDWLFSDVICYPARLLEYVERWLDSGKARNLVCTLKFQGATDLETARKFARIPGSRLAHLHHNKHELTWWRFGA